MSGFGVIRIALFLWWFISLGACIYLFLFRKTRIAAIAGLMSVLSLTGWLLLGSTRNREIAQSLAQKATTKIGECKAIGDRPVIRSGRTLVWDLVAGHAVSPTLSDLFRDMDPRPADVPVTVFLVSPEQSRQIGTYDISGMPAYKEWYEVYVVQFRNFNDEGTAVAMHQFWSSKPVRERPVRDSPEYGSFPIPRRDEEGRQVIQPPTPTPNGPEYHPSPPPIEEWIDSLPTQ